MLYSSSLLVIVFFIFISFEAECRDFACLFACLHYVTLICICYRSGTTQIQIANAGHNGVPPGQPSLPRDTVVHKLTELLFHNKFVILSSAPATGKTSILQILPTVFSVSRGYLFMLDWERRMLFLC
jgi:hypothetical protein